MYTISQVSDLMEGFVPYTEYGKELVQKGVELLIEGDENNAHLHFLSSGQGCKGLLYFAMRTHMPEEKESDIYNFILKYFH